MDREIASNSERCVPLFKRVLIFRERPNELMMILPKMDPSKLLRVRRRDSREIWSSLKSAIRDYAAVNSAAAGSAQRLIMHLCGELVSSEV